MNTVNNLILALMLSVLIPLSNFAQVSGESPIGSLRISKKELPKTQLIWISPKPLEDNINVEEGQLNIQLVAIEGKHFNKSDFKVYINGFPMPADKSGDISYAERKYFSTTIELENGVNKIYVKVGTSRSKTKTIIYNAINPDLYVLGFAPNYKHSVFINELNYTVNDAKAIAAKFETQQYKGIYGKVKIANHFGQQATANNLRGGLEKLTTDYKNQTIKKNDVVLIIISAHGQEANEFSVFRIRGNDYDPSKPTTTTVSSKEINRFLAQLPCRKILIIDACYSGGFELEDPLLASRGESDALQRRNDIIQTFAEHPLTVVFTSSQDNQKSYEHREWKHGAFTKVFLEGLSGKADTNKDRKITFGEINTYLTETVFRIVQKKKGKPQRPKMILKGIKADKAFFMY